MPLRWKPAQENDIPALVNAEWDAFETPLQPIFRLYCPIPDGNRAQGIADSIARQQTSTGCESVWIKVLDTEAEDEDKIIGGAQWLFITDHSSIEEEAISLAKRHPEGGARIFATQAFQALRAAEFNTRMDRGSQQSLQHYASLGSCFTISEYRRRGVGSLLMEWGLQEVDKRGLETWIEAAPSAVPFYEQHGFQQKGVVYLDLRRPGDLSGIHAMEWEATAKSILPVSAVIMCRPPLESCQA